MFLLFALHVPLGVLMYWFSALAILHPLTVIGLGMYWAMQKQEPIAKVAYVAAYMIGVEVLWRMAEAPVFWEFGKYGSALIMIAALVRRGVARVPSLPFFYLVLLIPACYVTFALNSWTDFRDRISFNMSGPICLFVCCWFFSQVHLTEAQLKKLILFIAIPLLSVAIATLFFTMTASDLQFNTESNPMTSGGFGPNQVSSMLGLGVFLTASALLLFRNDIKTTVFLVVLTLLFAAQSVLTFSRGGIYAAVGALMILAIFQARDFGQFIKRILPVIFVGVVFLLAVFPYLNNFTGGKLEERFESSDTTNRYSIMEMEIQMFAENPLFGVGVGEAISQRLQMSQQLAASHTEFTRLISEHGSLGVLAILSLVVASVLNMRKQTTRSGKALVAGSLVWAGLFLGNAGMRLAAPAFMWGLSFVLIVESASSRKALATRAKQKRNGAQPVFRKKRVLLPPPEESEQS